MKSFTAELSGQLRRLYCANIMKSSAPAKTTHQAIEIARNQVSRVIAPKLRAPIETASSQLGDIRGIHCKVNFWRPHFDLSQGSEWSGG